MLLTSNTRKKKNSFSRSNTLGRLSVWTKEFYFRSLSEKAVKIVFHLIERDGWLFVYTSITWFHHYHVSVEFGSPFRTWTPTRASLKVFRDFRKKFTALNQEKASRNEELIIWQRGRHVASNGRIKASWYELVVHAVIPLTFVSNFIHHAVQNTYAHTLNQIDIEERFFFCCHDVIQLWITRRRGGRK